MDILTLAVLWILTLVFRFALKRLNSQGCTSYVGIAFTVCKNNPVLSLVFYLLEVAFLLDKLLKTPES